MSQIITEVKLYEICPDLEGIDRRIYNMPDLETQIILKIQEKIELEHNRQFVKELTGLDYSDEQIKGICKILQVQTNNHIKEIQNVHEEYRDLKEKLKIIKKIL